MKEKKSSFSFLMLINIKANNSTIQLMGNSVVSM